MRADRLLSLVMLLQTRGKITASALADILGVSRRTILRDVDALSLAGIPIYTDSGPSGGIALDKNYRVSLTGLKESEVRALFVSSSNKLLSDVGLDEAANNTQLKLLAGLPQRHQSVVDHIRQRIHIDPLWWWYDSQSPPFWVELQNAVYEDRYINTVYENYDGKTNERILEPYSLVAKSSFWYLIAKREGEFRTYRVSRFQNVEMQNLHFQRDKDFDLASYWQDHLDEFAANLSMFSFTLRIHNSRINFAKWLAPGRHEIMREADESGWFIMRFHYESIDLAKMLVFGLGIQAVVIEPQELHDAVLEDARAIIRFNHR